MKDSNPGTSKMINKNWVLKRKRRKLPCGSDMSSGRENKSKPSESPANTSSVRRLKIQTTSERTSIKKKGNDGVSFFPSEEEKWTSDAISNA